MTALLDYRLSDLLMFSPDIYYRMLVRYNLDIWPLQILALALGLLLLRLMLRQKGLNRRIAGAILAIGWVWSGLVFNYLNFAPINWIAGYMSAAYVAQGLLLLLWGYHSGTGRDEGAEPGVGGDGDSAAWRLRRLVGVGLVMTALFGYPLLYPATGQDWQTAQIFLTSPGPTIAATLGLLLTLRRSLTVAFWLSLIPMLALLVEFLTLYTLGSVEWVALAAVGACVIAVWAIIAISNRQSAKITMS